MNIKHLLASLLFPVSWCALAAPFSVSADGQEVTDAKTGLIWRRCAEGMTASASRCTGNAGLFNHEAAFMRASSQATATGVAWRLPNVKELSSIVDRSRSNPTIDVVAFPDTPTFFSIYWSSSPLAVDAKAAWVVSFFNGNVGYDPSSRARLNGAVYVRLVRAGQ